MSLARILLLAAWSAAACAPRVPAISGETLLSRLGHDSWTSVSWAAWDTASVPHVKTEEEIRIALDTSGIFGKATLIYGPASFVPADTAHVLSVELRTEGAMASGSADRARSVVSEILGTMGSEGCLGDGVFRSRITYWSLEKGVVVLQAGGNEPLGALPPATRLIVHLRASDASAALGARVNRVPCSPQARS